jgi:hypothetical protein
MGILNSYVSYFISWKSSWISVLLNSKYIANILRECTHKCLPVKILCPKIIYVYPRCSFSNCDKVQCRINHMAEAAYATGPALLGAPRFWGPRASLFYFFSWIFCFLFQRGAQTVRQSGAPKSLSPPENLRPQKIGPKRFLFVPCFSVSARGPKEPKVPRKRYRPPKFKNGGPKVWGNKRFFCSLF